MYCEKNDSEQQALGGSTAVYSLFHHVAVLGKEKKALGKQTKAHRTPCYPISADSAYARGRHIPGITK